MEVAAACYLRDVACSYAPFLQVPVLRAFVRRYLAQCVPHDKARLSEYSAQASQLYSKISLSDEAMIRCAERYNLTEEEIIQMEALIYQSKPLTFLSHPGFMKMALVDYN